MSPQTMRHRIAQSLGFESGFPDYPNDTLAAVQLIQGDCNVEIQSGVALGKRHWHVWIDNNFGKGYSLPMAICEAYLRWKNLFELEEE